MWFLNTRPSVVSIAKVEFGPGEKREIKDRKDADTVKASGLYKGGILVACDAPSGSFKSLTELSDADSIRTIQACEDASQIKTWIAEYPATGNKIVKLSLESRAAEIAKG